MALDYADWSATCDTLHAHTQVLGKLAVALAPPEPQLLHAALRLTPPGWEPPPRPPGAAPGGRRAWGWGPGPLPLGSGAVVACLDLHAHEAVVEHSDGRVARIPLTPD